MFPRRVAHGRLELDVHRCQLGYFAASCARSSDSILSSVADIGTNPPLHNVVGGTSSNRAVPAWLTTRIRVTAGTSEPTARCTSAPFQGTNHRLMSQIMPTGVP
jgi:hypothetical protein